MNRSLLIALASAGLIGSLTAAAPAFATNGGGHAGRSPSTSGYCIDTDREGTSTVALPILNAPAGGQLDTLASGHPFDFCSNTATVSGSATYVYGEYSTGISWLHGWMNQGQFKRVVRIA